MTHLRAPDPAPKPGTDPPDPAIRAVWSPERRRRERVHLVATDLVLALAWTLAAAAPAALALPPRVRLPAIGVVLALFLASIGLHQPARSRRRGRFRLRAARPGLWPRVLPTAAVLLGIEVALFALLHLRPTGIPRPGAVPGLAAVSLSELTVAVLVAPWIEEALFRGSLQQRLERRWGPHLAILAVAAGFALLHLRPTALPGHLVAGVVYGYVAYGAQSIGPAIAVHALFNAGFALLAPGLAAGMLHHPAAAGTLTGLAAVALVALLHGPAMRAPSRRDTRFWSRTDPVP